MPKGKPNAQTVASAKYHEKAGYVSKSYKLKKEVADAFSEACEKIGISRARQLTKMMNEFVKKVNENNQ